MGFLDNLDNCDSINRFLARVETDNDRPEDIESGSPKTTGIPYSTDLLQILTRAIQQEASDVHLIAGYPPTLRVHGKIIPLDDNACPGADRKQPQRPYHNPLLPTLSIH